MSMSSNFEYRCYARANPCIDGTAYLGTIGCSMSSPENKVPFVVVPSRTNPCWCIFIIKR